MHVVHFILNNSQYILRKGLQQQLHSLLVTFLGETMQIFMMQGLGNVGSVEIHISLEIKRIRTLPCRLNGLHRYNTWSCLQYRSNILLNLSVQCLTMKLSELMEVRVNE